MKKYIALSVLGFAVSALVIAATTTRVKESKNLDLILYDNETFHFSVEVAPDSAVDGSWRGFWVKKWPGFTRISANVPVDGYQMDFCILRDGLFGKHPSENL